MSLIAFNSSANDFELIKESTFSASGFDNRINIYQHKYSGNCYAHFAKQSRLTLSQVDCSDFDINQEQYLRSKYEDQLIITESILKSKAEVVDKLRKHRG